MSHGAGHVVVFLHGLGTSAASWSACAEELSGRYHTVAVDLLGHGSSPVPDDPVEYTRDRALVDLDELLISTRSPDSGRAVLVGHSLGGYLALAHVATRPGAVRGIVLVNTGPGYRDDVKRDEWNERSRRNAHRFGVPEQVTNLNLQHDSIVMDSLEDMATPALVIAGGDDRPEYANAGRYLERKMPDARLVVVEGGGHSLHESTHSTEVARLIAGFIDGLPPEPN